MKRAVKHPGTFWKKDILFSLYIIVYLCRDAHMCSGLCAYVYVYVYMCVCACAIKREQGTDRKRGLNV